MRFPKTEFLTANKTLWTSFVALILLSLGFLAVMQIWQFEIIDEIYDARKLTDHLAAMTAEQKHVHAWTTGTLDVAYPFAYGILFIGMALRHFGKAGPFLALFPTLCIPVDLLEGLIQIKILSGDLSLIPAKSIVTPIKLALFSIGALTSLGGLGKILWHRIGK